MWSEAAARLNVMTSRTFRCLETDNIQSIVDWLTGHDFTPKYENLGSQD